jgi:hypothetical protein
MFKLLSSLIKLSDFEQTKHEVLLNNDTSGTGVFDLGKIKINSLEEESINLTLPSKTLGPNHNVTLYIYENPVSEDELKKIKSKNFKSSIEFIGKVKELINEGKEQSAQIELTQFDKFKWKAICAKYNQAQSKVLELIEQNEVEDDL